MSFTNATTSAAFAAGGAFASSSRLLSASQASFAIVFTKAGSWPLKTRGWAKVRTLTVFPSTA